jgi:hypothetical protein
VFAFPDDIVDLIQFDQTNLNVVSREGKHREFKSHFVVSDLSEYTKTLASFANAGGGVLIFGVGDKPRQIRGSCEILDEARWADRLREDFAPEIEIATKVYTVSGLTLFAVGVDPSLHKPILCRKTRSKQIEDKDGKRKDIEVLREGTIYYRYAAQTRPIGFAELSALFDERDRRRMKAVMETLRAVERVGFENAGVVSMSPGASTLFVSRETAKGLSFIDKGRFVEEEGAPAYVVLGQVDLNKVVHAPLDEADKNLPTEAANALKPLIREVYGAGSSISAQQVSKLLTHLKIGDDNVHCVQEKKLARKYVTRAGIKALDDYVRTQAIRVFGSKLAIGGYEDKLKAKAAAEV